MKKRISAILLSVVLCLGMLGITVGAWKAEGTAGQATITVSGVDGKKLCALWGDKDYTQLLLLFCTDESGKAAITVDRALTETSAYYVGVQDESAKQIDIVSPPGGGTSDDNTPGGSTPGNTPGSTGSTGGGGGGGGGKPSIKPGETQTPTTSGGVAGFDDVAAGAWYAEYVRYVADKGLFNGVSEGRFAPEANMTRAMMWTVLARYKGVNTNSGSGVWYAAARAWAVENGISDGTMADANVTREQFVTMLWRLSGEPAATNSASFTDGGRISDYAKTAVAWASAQGIVNGYSDGSFKPQGSATRAEVAKMLTVFCTNAETARDAG